MVKSKKQPRQPVELDERGVARFRRNHIVRYLLDKGDIDMNDLAFQDFSEEDREQFAQLIGYSVAGFGDLSYASDEVYEDACVEAEQLEEKHFTIQEQASGLLEMGAKMVAAEIVEGLLTKVEELEKVIEEQRQRISDLSWSISPERMGR